MVHTLELDGSWALSGPRCRKRIPATVPGCVHTDLLAARVIEDPYYRENENDVQWIGESDWTYSRTFDVGPEVLARDRVVLRCEGLDTLAELRVNGQVVGRADNAFRTWEFDVRPALRPGVNLLAVRFHSVFGYAEKCQKKRPLPDGDTGNYKIPDRSWVRKSPCNFGWDWGPRLITCGIWRSISILSYDAARISDLAVRQDHSSPGVVRLDVDLAVEVIRPTRLWVRFRVEYEGRPVGYHEADLVDGHSTAAIPIRDPRLWWPNGLGEQPLYHVVIELLDDHGATLDTWTRRVGLRTLRLDRHADEWGESFQFAVNGVPFFAKGANWIPADTFVSRLARDDYSRLLRDAADAHMNMLRVWGGGIYEYDAFYELCDELGICVWQDFMFACATYPTFDGEFMRNVEAEARDSIRRLRHHPCLALWCGTNEIEQGLVGDQWNGRQMSWEDYSRLFDDLLSRVVRELDPHRDYWPCSPHSPRGDRRDFNNPGCGDAHLWDVWHGREPFEWYHTSSHRFCSEFGFQSFPEPRTVESFTTRADRNITSAVMEHHQRSGIGNAVIVHYMLSWFRMPTSFESTLWLSQILQGLGIKYGVDHWRRNRPRVMGALYWQLNDCWPVASWSSVDWFGRWKALHYFARRFFAPIAISAVEDADAGCADLFVVSDSVESRRGRIRWVATTAAGRTVGEGDRSLRIPPQSARSVQRLNLRRLLRQYGPRDLLVWIELLVDDVPVSSDLALFERPKHIDLPAAGITTSVQADDIGGFSITLKSRRPALWAWIEIDGVDARFSDNFFHLRPGVARTIGCAPVRGLTVAEIRRHLRVRSLVDTYDAR